MISRNALAKTLFLPKNKCRFGMLLTPKIVQNQVKVSLHNYSNVSDKFEMNVWVSIECPFTVPWVTLDRYMNNESNLTAMMKFHETSPAILNDAGLPTKMIRNPRNQGNLPNNMRSQYRVAVDHLQVQQYHICICIYIYIYIYIGMSFSVRGHQWPPRPPVAPSKNGGPLKRWPLQISTYSFGATKLKVSWSNVIWNKSKTSVYKLCNVINSKRWRMAI